MQAWNEFSNCAAVPAYQPSSADLAFGNTLFNQWITFATTLQLETAGMMPVNAAPGFPADIAVAVQNGTAPTVSYRRTCTS